MGAHVENEKQQIISQLRQNILLMQSAPAAVENKPLGLGPLEAAFPNKVFPRAALHEFVSTNPEGTAATSGFICSLLASLMQANNICLWVGRARLTFPPALTFFGIRPDRVIFIDPERDKDVLWITEEALKCEGLSAVVAAIDRADIAHSRRLQLAIERSRVTGLILSNNRSQLTSAACAARWQITPLPSLTEGVPGVGHPRWNVALQKVRNGTPGQWELEWTPEGFTKQPAITILKPQEKRKAV